MEHTTQPIQRTTNSVHVVGKVGNIESTPKTLKLRVKIPNKYNEANWWTCVIFHELAHEVAKEVQVGHTVEIWGSLDNHNYEGKQIYRVIVKKLIILTNTTMAIDF